MALGADRYASRGDTFAFFGCVLLSVAAMSLPERIRDPLARSLRQTVLAPFLALQQQTELLSASLARYDAVVAQRDSAALAATFLPELRSENTRLRSLLGLGTRLSSGYVPAEVLHEPEPSSALSFIVSAGKNQGVKPLSAVVSPEGLVGIVSSVDAKTRVVVTWAHPEFRASAMARNAGCAQLTTTLVFASTELTIPTSPSGLTTADKGFTPWFFPADTMKLRALDGSGSCSTSAGT